MNPKASLSLAAMFALAACASPSPRGDLTGTRTAFHNPYATIERFEEEGRVDALFYPGAGRFAFDSEGNRIRLSQAELRAVRSRAAAVNSIIILRDALASGERVALPFERLDPRDRPAPVDPSPDAPPIATPPAADPGEEPR
ncbi:hypothetical protein [Erythrobacter sp.]|uniref:hypothetical protein n=1 Tax=Erythrobacter sp. TaxID=1042 RepID=UPI001425CCB6|nr:hypothetical protein [Erythrobacter sp.]QIQ86540.1 MAG: hypothetical protein G9473_07465 [Erythrobacter sp.]